MPKVLIADKLSPSALGVFSERGIDAEARPGISREALLDIAGDYDAIAVRSATKLTADIIQAAKKLKVIGRAGIGVDNIDVDAATAAGVIVMNAPFGNSITTAEHTIALLMALARDLPAANASTHSGRWEKERFVGTELYGKTLGIIGAGNIGGIVADRAKGLKMKVIAYDPWLPHERAALLGIEKVELNDLLARSDFVSLHVPLTPETRNILSAEAIARMKKGARLINCARGGLVDETALKRALESGHLKGAALDVFEEEPARSHALFGDERVIATPHLGASSSEAQEKVAVQIAEQISDFLLSGAVVNALNSPALSAEEANRARPWLLLAERLGAFAGQLTETGILSVHVVYEGTPNSLNRAALTQAALAGLLHCTLAGVNMVNAPLRARERGIAIEETSRDRQGAYEGYIKLAISAEGLSRDVAGTVFSDGRPRLIQVKGIDLEAEFAPHMLYVTNEDKPGFIGRLGTELGDAGINIAAFALGRRAPGADAIALVEVDSAVDERTLIKIRNLPLVGQAKALAF
ncbi:MAG TPA: phosphoglycerate dehydrogenase [Rhizomicrobium sp.]|nr:phosphoglycerate dehydrogenase [Rhizomicrobium sp.]